VKTRAGSEEVSRLTAEVDSLKARLEALEGKSTDGNGRGLSQSRRDLLKLAGAAAAGAAGSIVLGAIPAEAISGAPMVLGNSTTNDTATTTDTFPSTGAAPSPLFQATGQGVSAGTTVPPTASVTAPMVQSIPLIGGIGAGGTLPNIGSPAVADYPGFAPIQGVGGFATIATATGNQVVSEGVNGYGAGTTGIGITGESDLGYGVVGGSGGIDIAALGNGRILQLTLLDASLTNAPAGPPNYTPNDFEQVRDRNGLLYVSVAGGTWIPVQLGGLNQALFTAVTTKQLGLQNSDGQTFADMMPVPGLTGGPDLVLSITPAFNCVAILMGNASLFTNTAGINQDIGIFVSGSTAPQGIVGWAEAGGFNGTFSPNAAFVQAVYPMTRGTVYNVRLKWKANKAQSGSQSIYSGAGPFPAGSGSTNTSPTRLTALLVTA
jgi:hypothetical protein